MASLICDVTEPAGMLDICRAAVGIGEARAQWSKKTSW